MLHVLFSTFPNEEKAVEAAKYLINEKLAACVWVIPGLKSFYVWEGMLEEDSEVLLVAKVPEEKVDSAIKKLKEVHPYEVPEIITVAADKVLPEYLKWAREVCGVEG